MVNEKILVVTKDNCAEWQLKLKTSFEQNKDFLEPDTHKILLKQFTKECNQSPGSNNHIATLNRIQSRLEPALEELPLLRKNAPELIQMRVKINQGVDKSQSSSNTTRQEVVASMKAVALENLALCSREAIGEAIMKEALKEKEKKKEEKEDAKKSKRGLSDTPSNASRKHAKMSEAAREMDKQRRKQKKKEKQLKKQREMVEGDGHDEEDSEQEEKDEEEEGGDHNNEFLQRS